LVKSTLLDFQTNGINNRLMVERIITADQLIESLRIAKQYEEIEDSDSWALAVRLSVDDDVAKLPENEKKIFLAKIRAGQ
jgi:hypothetical protein